MASKPETETLDQVTISSCLYETYDSRHHNLYVRCWSQHIRAGTGKQVKAEQHRHQYAFNPFGRSFVTVARTGDRWVGAISAIPTRLIRGSIVQEAFQIGDFMVDAEKQGQGIGFRILKDLTRCLAGSGRPVYTFPNSRSIGLFLKQGYRELRRLPSTLFAIVPGVQFLKRDAHAEDVPLGDAAALADKLALTDSQPMCLLKDGAYLRWRYAGIRDPSAYRFTVMTPQSGTDEQLLVSTRYRFKGMPFLVLLDVIPRKRHESIGLTHLQGGLSLGFGHRERDLADFRPRVRMDVPGRFDPRPMRLLVPPNDEGSAELFSACYFTTGDSMGF